MKKIAILQNQFRISGRTRVVCEVISLLNEFQIVPNLLTFTSETVTKHAIKALGYDQLKLNFERVAPIPFKRGWLAQIILMNSMTYHKHTKYDLVFNSNNTLHGLNPDANYLHYIYYPIAITYQELERFAEYSSRNWRQIYGAALGKWLGLQPMAKANNIYGISKFSKAAIQRLYPDAEVGIIYPPAVYSDNIEANGQKVYACISTGSFTNDKRQLDQLVIAKNFPDMKFNIVGTIKSDSYFQACLKYIEREQLVNIQLWPDLPFLELETLLRSSAYFLHTKHDEHFGISTVEAIAAGCIPIVHDSGGQREIVPFEELRFNDPEEAVKVIRGLTANHQRFTELKPKLQQHIKQFSNVRFRESMEAAIRTATNI